MQFQIPEGSTGVVVQEPAGLMWTRENIGSGWLNHADATQAAADCRIGEFDDWRLPTVEELFLLADRSRYSPALDTEAFPTCESAWYWTASPDASFSDYAWIVYFYDGEATITSRNLPCAVRAVRSLAPASQ